MYIVVVVFVSQVSPGLTDGKPVLSAIDCDIIVSKEAVASVCCVYNILIAYAITLCLIYA